MIHDTLLFYTGGEKHTWNVQYTDYDPEYIKAEFREDENGELVKYENLTGAALLSTFFSSLSSPVVVKENVAGVINFAPLSALIKMTVDVSPGFTTAIHATSCRTRKYKFSLRGLALKPDGTNLDIRARARYASRQRMSGGYFDRWGPLEINVRVAARRTIHRESCGAAEFEWSKEPYLATNTEGV